MRYVGFLKQPSPSEGGVRSEVMMSPTRVDVGAIALGLHRGPLKELCRLPLGPSLISYRHETDRSGDIILGPRLTEPVMIELIILLEGCYTNASY